MSGREVDGRAASVPALAIRVHTPREPRELPPSPYRFGDVRYAPGEGPLAEGGDFAPATIIAAYRAGVFPWPHPGAELLWFSPDPRAIIPIGGLHVSRRLARRLRGGRFTLTVDRAFREVMAACAIREEGSWITPRLLEAYTALQELGWAHSVEAWTGGGELVGGLYGIRVGRMFGAESMFHSETDASKVAMVAMMQWAASEGIELIDVQVLNAHTASMGAVEIEREEYVERLRAALA